MVMLTPPLSSVGPTPFIVLTKKSYLYCQIIINNLTLVTMVTAITWKKVVLGKLRLHKPVTDWLETLPHSIYKLNM